MAKIALSCNVLKNRKKYFAFLKHSNLAQFLKNCKCDFGRVYMTTIYGRVQRPYF
jgi:hypothetical protein